MKRFFHTGKTSGARFLALLMTGVLLVTSLTGCAASDYTPTELSFSEVEYQRPDGEAVVELIEKAQQQAQEDLLPVGMFVVLDYVWSRVKEDRTAEKAIFLDEVWQLIGASSNEMAAEYVLEIFKIIRGYGGSAVCATQDLSDFMALKDGKYGRGIINACKTKIVLNLENDEAKKVQELLHLSEAERMEIVHFERGKGMISTNSNNLTLEFRASQLEKDLITTDRKDLKELKARLEKYGNQAFGRKAENG